MKIPIRRFLNIEGAANNPLRTFKVQTIMYGNAHLLNYENNSTNSCSVFRFKALIEVLSYRPILQL